MLGLGSSTLALGLNPCTPAAGLTTTLVPGTEYTGFPTIILRTALEAVLFPAVVGIVSPELVWYIGLSGLVVVGYIGLAGLVVVGYFGLLGPEVLGYFGLLGLEVVGYFGLLGPWEYSGLLGSWSWL